MYQSHLHAEMYEMRIKIAALSAFLLLAGALACGGGDENNAGDPADVPGVDASGTADTEIFTDSPDTTGVPVAGQGGTMADSAAMGGGGMTGGSTTGGTDAGAAGGGTTGTTTTP
jgi:hypothetical protein